MNALYRALDEYKISNFRFSDTKASEGFVVDVTLFFDKKNRVTGGMNGTPVIFYTVGINIPRIGTDSDADIIRRMLCRGYVVIVLDYLNNEGAVPPVLDRSVQSLRNKLLEKEFVEKFKILPEERCVETFVVPAGYDISLNNVFWSIDKHSADGTLEKITEIWNNDFRGVHGEKVILWTDSDGNRKCTQNAFDNTSPVWLDKNGAESKDGKFIKIKYTKAMSINDCVQADGKPLNLDMCMHIIYPTNPENPVPVMCLANSAQHMVSCASMTERPQLNGVVFRGYAGVLYDYVYTPMARTDHYDYFDGCFFPGKSITGDSVTYSMQFYNDKKMNTAAMRFLRYLALSDKRFCFKENSIGVFGNSKGGWMTFLGEEHPETFKDGRFLPGHHGESRYDNGKTEPDGYIRGGEEQPWLSFNGKTLDSGADFIYAGCGGSEDFITKGHCPMYITGNMKDSSFLGRTNSMVNLCRIYDIPSVYLEVDLGHTLAYGKDKNYGVDSYETFFKMADYYLKDAACEVLYTVPADGTQEVSVISPVVIKFIGDVDIQEIRKITVTDSKNNIIQGEWSSMYGNTEWCFKPETAMNYEETYKVIIPDSLQGNNGKHINSKQTFSFKTEKGALLSADAGGTVSFHSSIITKPVEFNDTEKVLLRVFVKNDAANILQIYSVTDNETQGDLIGEINISGPGAYELDITEYIKTRSEKSNVSLMLKAAKKSGEFQIFSQPLSENPGGGTMGECMDFEFSASPDGKKALKINNILLSTRFKNNYFYTNTELYGYDSIVYTSDSFLRNVSKKDYGRKFNVKFSVYDNVSRKLKVELNSCNNTELSVADYNRNTYNVKTVQNRWTDIEFDYRVYDSMYGKAGEHDKFLIIKSESTGNIKASFYIADINVTETVSDIEIKEVSFGVCY